MMAIVLSPHQFHDPGLGSGPSSLLRTLDYPQSKALLRQLMHVLCPPFDAPRLLDVLNGAFNSVKCYGSTLRSPSESFLRVMSDFESLLAEAHPILDTYMQNCELHHPLLRRLSLHPAWALFMELSRAPENLQIEIAAGVELALSLAKEKPFPKAYANNLRIALKDAGENGVIIQVERQPLYLRHFGTAKQEASALFEKYGSSEHGLGVSNESFEDRARQYLLRNQFYATPKHRQGVLDQRSQSRLQLVQSARELFQKARKGDHAAYLVILAFCCGLSVELIRYLPLQMHAPDEWLMAIDIQTGIVKTNIEGLFPDSASVPDNASANFREANKIVVKPLPKFVASFLAKELAGNPTAQTIGELLPNVEVSGASLTITECDSGIAPSVARFLNSAAPYGIQIGIDRLAAAAITNDFAVIPGSKFYYTLVTRNHIWSASLTMFKALGWGIPVKFLDGLAAGSCVVPRIDAISRLFEWMVEQVRMTDPGKRYTYDSLMAHHNVYAMCCATIAIICLASRLAVTLCFTAAGLDERNMFTPVFDKPTGPFPGALPVPINQTLREVIEFWRAHCFSLDNRLEKLGFPINSHLRSNLKDILERKNVKLFFRISGRRPVAIGTKVLSAWWPHDIRLNANFGRDLWEVELPRHDIKSSEIDMLLRHQLFGMESHTSTSNVVLANWHQKICQAQEAILGELGIRAIAGLSAKKYGSKHVQ